MKVHEWGVAVLVGIAGVAQGAAAQTPVPTAMVVPEGTVLDITATGSVKRTPDVATIRVGVVTQDATAAAAMAENARRTASVSVALEKAGVPARDIATSDISLSPRYRHTEDQPPVITGYQASNMVTVTFRDVRKAGPALDALVRAGANQIDGPTLSLAKPDEALDAAREDAVAKARARAALYARVAGLAVQRVVAIDEAGENGGDRPRPIAYNMASMARADAASAVQPGETEVSATLRVRFLLK